MRHFETTAAAESHLEDIYGYTLSLWGREQARAYVAAIIDTFQAIASYRVASRRIPATFGIDGYVCKCGSHLIYWRCGEDDVVRIVAILHERMLQSLRLREALDGEP